MIGNDLISLNAELTLALPAGYGRIRVVANFEELMAAPFVDGVNAACWPRALPGNFREVAGKLEGDPGIATVEEDVLRALTLSGEGVVARDILLADQALLRSFDLSPVLDCVTGSPRDPGEGAIPTDVYSYHADSATVAADTYLCSYTGACSEGLRNDEAIRRIDVPETRAMLLGLYGGRDDEGFADYLNENFYDLHYIPQPGARPFSFGLHHLWRIALEYPGSPVPPCIHRAPLTLPGMDSRLLLLS